jgi:peptidyl-prolyl cis-trans isomerase B (cyclophilin B)
MKRVVILLIFLVALSACVPVEENFDTGEENTMYDTIIVVETSKGNFEFGLYDQTPLHKENMIKLVNEKFYDGLTFHRFVDGFVVQGGDPLGDGTGGSSENVALEVVGLSQTRGTIGMARSGEPDSASSQWYVNLADNTFLDQDYTVFGIVTKGMEVVDTLRVGDTMDKVYVQ